MAKRIDVSDLTIFYGAFRAVEDVTVSLEPRADFNSVLLSASVQHFKGFFRSGPHH